MGNRVRVISNALFLALCIFSATHCLAAPLTAFSTTDEPPAKPPSPIILFDGIAESSHYKDSVRPTISVSQGRITSIVLNDKPYDSSPIHDEGDYVLRAVAVGDNGKEVEQTIRFTIDSSPPVVTVHNVEHNRFYSRDITPRITIRDRNLKKKTMLLNGHDLAPDTAISGEGRYLLDISAEDTAGNATQLHIDFLIDTTPPATSMNAAPHYSDNEGTVYVKGDALVTATAEDTGMAASDISGIECRLDGTGDWLQYRAPISLSGLSDGMHTVYCFSTDRAGNRESEQKFSFIVQNSAPVTALTLSSPYRVGSDEIFIASPSTIFTLFASGSASGIALTEYQIDEGPWEQATRFSIGSEGTHVVRFRSTDKLGNKETPKTLRVLIDAKPPATSISVGNPKFEAANNRMLYASPLTSFTLSSSNPVAGVGRTEYRIDNRRWTEYKPFTIEPEGKHVIEYRTIDAIGNAEVSKSQHVTVDATPPVTTALLDGKKAEPGATIYRKGDTSISLTATDALSGVRLVEYRIGSGQWRSFEPFRITQGDRQDIFYRSIDNVGNSEEPKKITIALDKTPPATKLEVGSPKMKKDEMLHVTTSTRFTLHATDPESGISSTEYRLDGGEWKPYAPFTVTPPGKHLLDFRSTDNVGNQEHPYSVLVTVNDTPPSTLLRRTSEPAPVKGNVFLQDRESLSLQGIGTPWEVSKTEYRLGDGSWMEYSKPLTFSEEGKFLLHFRSKDKGGNEEPVQTVSVVVDKTPPLSEMGIGTPKRELDGVMHIETETVITPTATDNLSGVRAIHYQLSGHSVETDGVPFSVVSKGDYVLTYWSLDRSGNSEIPRSVRLTVTPSPKRFAAEDLLLGNELVETVHDSTQEKVVAKATPPLDPSSPAEPLPPYDDRELKNPPDDFAVVPVEQQEKRNPLLKFVMGIAQALLILGVMLL
ncbi:Ig-like domain (group 3) [Geobacter sp. DSM 9736]|nr:Ig-like domain (group 3) [Geobacter sp. DSM 9736]